MRSLTPAILRALIHYAQGAGTRPRRDVIDRAVTAGLLEHRRAIVPPYSHERPVIRCTVQGYEAICADLQHALRKGMRDDSDSGGYHG